MHNVTFHWLASWFYVAKSAHVWSKIIQFEKKSEYRKCIRMGITVLKIVIMGCKSSVLWSQIAFYQNRAANDQQ